MNDKIERLLKNYSNARRSWECWCFLVNFNLDPPRFDVRLAVDKNPLLFHLRYLSLKDFYIESYKILKDSKNNSDNIFTLLRQLKENEPKKLQKAESLIEELSKNHSVIDRVCQLRDKYYAHLDKDYENITSSVSIPDILQCFIAIENAIIELSSREILNEYLEKIPSRNELSL